MVVVEEVMERMTAKGKQRSKAQKRESGVGESSMVCGVCGACTVLSVCCAVLGVS